MKIGIISDLSQNSGLGHIRRMNVLSKELKRQSAHCIFLFSDDEAKYINEHTKGLEVHFYKKNNDKHNLQIFQICKKLRFSILILDTYTIDIGNINELFKNNFFVVAIDDHLRKYNANIIFSNRAMVASTVYNKNVRDNWFFGPKYCLINSNIKRRFNPEFNKKVLLHSGGSSLFENTKELNISTLNACKEYNFELSIICSNQKSINHLKELIDLQKFSGNIKILPFISNLHKKLNEFDIVVGPTGTMTFETIASQVVPFTVPLTDDGRDSAETWPCYGHLMHLNFKESKNLKILNNSWKFLVNNYKNLRSFLIKNSNQLDGLGAQRVANKILNEFNSSKNNLSNKNRIFDKKITESKPTPSEEIRLFFDTRNKKFVRNMSSNPNHVILWPEHLEWWLNKKIKKMSLYHEGKLVSFYWSKSVKDSNGTFIITGWFPVKKSMQELKISYLTLKYQVKQVKLNYKNASWIITMSKNNRFVYSLNKNLGFNKASKMSIQRAVKHFKINENMFDFMEMKL